MIVNTIAPYIAQQLTSSNMQEHLDTCKNNYYKNPSTVLWAIRFHEYIETRNKSVYKNFLYFIERILFPQTIKLPYVPLIKWIALGLFQPTDTTQLLAYFSDTGTCKLNHNGQPVWILSDNSVQNTHEKLKVIGTFVVVHQYTWLVESFQLINHKHTYDITNYQHQHVPTALRPNLLDLIKTKHPYVFRRNIRFSLPRN